MTEELLGLAFGGAFLLAGLIGFLVIYIYGALVLQTIAKKTNTENPWLAWIPIANLYLMITIIKKPWWWIFGFFLSIIPFIGPLLSTAFFILVWWKIAEERQKPAWVSIFMIIPLVNLGVMGYLAWSK